MNDGVYDGNWYGNGALVTSINPATGEKLATVRQASAADTEAVIRASRDAFELWRHVPSPRRGEILRQIRGALEAKLDDLGSLFEDSSLPLDGLEILM